MARKAYSEKEREQIKLRLLQVSLKLFSQKGFRGVRLIDIVVAVGISKPFFYTFYSSMEELVIKALEYQAELLLEMAVQLKKEKRPYRDTIMAFIQRVVHSRESYFFIMTQEEQVWVYNHLKPENYEAFQQGQVLFYTKLLQAFDILPEQCRPKLLANMILTILLVHNSAKRSLPFLYTDILQETAQGQTEALVDYLLKVSG